VREQRSVAEADERVDERRRLQHDLDAVVRDAEEIVRLDQLEALVRERGGVDRDLRAHRPGRVGERLLDRHVLELVACAAAERPARRGEDELGDGLAPPPLEALEHSRVLRVDGEQQSPAELVRPQREVAGGDEALLVRERERHSALERPERRAHAGETDDRVQHDVGLGAVEQLGEVASDLHVLDAVLGCERLERRRAGRERAELELRVPLDDLDRLAADRARRAEEGDTPHGLSVGTACQYPNAATT
jgi:hypothetical protein